MANRQERSARTLRIHSRLPVPGERDRRRARRRLDVVLQVSNFHYRAAGHGAHTPGQQDELAYEKWVIDIKSVFLFGCLFIMFLYHMALFLMRPQDRQFAYMALFCLIISLRPLFTGNTS